MFIKTKQSIDTTRVSQKFCNIQVIWHNSAAPVAFCDKPQRTVKLQAHKSDKPQRTVKLQAYKGTNYMWL